MSAVVTLQDAGFEVLEAQNSDQALAILARHPEVSIMLTDVRMPGLMDGLALIAQVNIHHPAIRSIVVSGHASATEAIEAGAKGFLPKPYMAHTMVRCIHDTAKH